MSYTIHDLILKGPQNGDNIAIKGISGKPLTYDKLRIQINYVVTLLNSLGFKKNDQIIVSLPNGPDMAVAFLSIAAGFSCIPISIHITINEFKNNISDLNPKALLIESGFNSPIVDYAKTMGIEIIEIVPQPDKETGLFEIKCRSDGAPANGSFASEDDIALILFTSGTTSKSKIVPLTQSNICSCAKNCISVFNLGENDTGINIMPLIYVQGLCTALLTIVLAGGTVVCTPGFDEEKIIEWFNKFQPTFYTSVPAIHAKILKQINMGNPLINNKLRVIRSAGSPLDQNLKYEMEKATGAYIFESYGMTESPIITINSIIPTDIKKGSVGKPAGTEVAIINESGEILGSGQLGEIVIRGPNVIKGYHQATDVNKSVFVNEWLKTGDLGLIDSDGYLFIKGRLKEFINRGGEKVSPYEIENVLVSHQDIAEAVAFKIPSEELGEEIAAAVKLKQNKALTENDIKIYISEHLSFFKVPKKIVFLDEIPVFGPAKKISRNKMSDFLSLSSTNTMTGKDTDRAQNFSSNKMVDELINIWTDVLKINPVRVNDDFFSIGGNSIKAANLVAQINNKFDLKLPLNVVFKYNTIEKMAEIINNKSAESDSYVYLQKGSGTPLFCFPGVNGSLLLYSNIVNNLRKDRLVIGIQPINKDLSDITYDDIEHMCSFYVKTIKAIQPNGPYYLLGHSYAAAVAYECARQLGENGEKIAFLGNIDLAPPGVDFWDVKKIFKPSIMKLLIKESPNILMNFITASNQEKKAHISKATDLLNSLLMIPFGKIRNILQYNSSDSGGTRYPNWINDNPEYLRYYTKRNRDCLYRYRPKKFDQKMTIFLAISKKTIGYIYRLQDPTIGWKDIVKEIDYVFIDGNHINIIKMPYVQEISKKIEEVYKAQEHR